MGISGLLPLLKSIHKHCTLKKFAGQTIGIDAYGWLHRGTVACAIELATDKPTTKYVDFAMSRVRMLLDFGITPYLVFDGANLPSKAGTNQDRRKRRDESKALGLELYKAGKISQAHQELQKAADVTPYMARQLIEELKRLNIQYVVAPYEADAQLAYLERKGIINGVLSEDSDLLVFGVKCLLTKLNQYGECVEINRADFASCKEISLIGWTDTMFRQMAILSGCDYLPNINKMGLKTAYRYIRKYKDAEKVLRMLQFEEQFTVPVEYLENFKKAELTFLHHRVFCPVEQKLVFLSELGTQLKEVDLPFLGQYVEPDQAIGVACGDLNPKTKEPMVLSRPSSIRPQIRDQRRQTLSSSSDLKHGKSIDSFFKSHRQPLAELDPNSLTPTPSQQRLLHASANASWEVRTVSSAPQLRRTTTSMSSSSGTVRSIMPMTDRAEFLARASTKSVYQPPKRPRLCSETSPTQEIKQSPFFKDHMEKASPLAQKKARNKKAKKGGFDVWSDDSVDEILLGLADEHESGISTPTLTVKQQITEGTKSEQTDSPEISEEANRIPQSPAGNQVKPSPSLRGGKVDTAETELKIAHTGISQLTASTSLGEHDEDDASVVFLEAPNNNLDELFLNKEVSQPSTWRNTELETVTSRASFVTKSIIKTFIAQSPEKQTLALSGLQSPNPSKTPAETRQINLKNTFSYQTSSSQAVALQSLNRIQSQDSKIKIGRSALNSTGLKNPPRGSMTSLQTLSQDAMRAKNSNEPKLVNSRRLSPPQDLKAEERPGLEEDLPSPLSVYVKRQDNELKGSEDLLVPNSDEISEVEESPIKSKLELRAYAFMK